MCIHIYVHRQTTTETNTLASCMSRLGPLFGDGNCDSFSGSVVDGRIALIARGRFATPDDDDPVRPTWHHFHHCQSPEPALAFVDLSRFSPHVLLPPFLFFPLRTHPFPSNCSEMPRAALSFLIDFVVTLGGPGFVGPGVWLGGGRLPAHYVSVHGSELRTAAEDAGSEPEHYGREWISDTAAVRPISSYSLLSLVLNSGIIGAEDVDLKDVFAFSCRIHAACCTQYGTLCVHFSSICPHTRPQSEYSQRHGRGQHGRLGRPWHPVL